MSKNFLIAAYERLQARLRRYSLSHSEEDALHDAFLKLWTGKYHPADEGEASRLLYTGMRRRQISLWRSEKRHPKMPATDVLIAEPPPEADEDDVFLKINELVMTQLTTIGKEILISHDVSGETYEEIAKRLGMQEAAVRMQLSRARKKIRDIYKQTKQ